MISYWLLERIKDTKRVIKKRKLKMDKQYNDKKKGTQTT